MKRKLEVIVSPHAGYCFGVKRAMSIIENGLNVRDRRVYTIGDVIHNPQAVDRLLERGVTPVSSMDKIEKGGTLIIRAHGVHPDIIEEAARRGINLIDTTCPFVRKSQDYVLKISQDSRRVIIIGDEEHPEVKGIAGRVTGQEPVILNSTDEAENIPGLIRAGVVIQTTFSRSDAMKIIEILRERIEDLLVFDTICQATSLRRQATLELAEEVDFLLIVGGRESSNTKRLYEMCVKRGIPSRFIEKAEEIQIGWFDGCEKIGLTTGTSTPKWVIEEVLERLSGISESF